VNRPCLVAGMAGLLLFGFPRSASSQSARVTRGVRPALMRWTPPIDRSAAETGSATSPRPRRNAMMMSARVLTETVRHGLVQHIEHQLRSLRPPLFSRVGLSLSHKSVLARLANRHAIESISPRLRDAARTFHFTLRVAF
jgi:hypothetical protein